MNLAHRVHVLLPCLVGTVLLGACQQAPSDSAPATAPTQSEATVAAPATPEVPQTRFIRAEPASLPDCSPAVVTLTWDTSSLAPPPMSVRVHILARNSERLFAAGGAQGRAETGRWALPGSTFSLHNGETGEKLESVVIGGPSCRR
ncbi:hypothetical protein FQY83_14685 [Luteimonas marina]|uniref:Uncharacterized protein n=1 Tax=Luteimonas marina TaxID=488485 RepID=A0A5C5TZP0_9GAMM|nr:hypothetical protein [Luteimonas marina]TWT18620.1 hypothetical protein FQY83_14685 [Luteimonas marina]